MKAAESATQKQRGKIVSMVNKIQTAMMVTRSGDGSMHGRPMATAEVTDELEAMYFATRRDSGKTAEIADDSHVCLGYVNASGSEWVSITGKATLVSDRRKAAELWRAEWKNWFEGPDDPQLLLIRVVPDEAEYWDAGSKALVMAKLAASAVTGKSFDMGGNERVSLD